MPTKPYRIAIVIVGVAFALPVRGASGAAAYPCGSSVDVRNGDAVSIIAHRCDVSEAALLNANPAIEGSGDLQVGGTLHTEASGGTQQKVGSMLSSFSRKATNAVGAP